MSYLKNQVLDSLKWKKSLAYCASRLGISEQEYINIKGQVLNKFKKTYKKQNSNITESVDLEKGQSTISGSFTYEPKTAEEIIKLLKIDTKVWKLSQYWNKQMGDHWRVSALITKIKENSKEDLLVNLLNNWKPKVYKTTSINKSYDSNKTDVCGVISLQDIHFGKQGNETIDKDFEDTIINLLNKGVASHNIKVLYFVVGGDLINMDTFAGTTTAGTVVDNCMSATDAYMQAFDAMHWAIGYIKQYCEKLVVVYIPGNHDRLSSHHLVHALSKSISNEGDIVWDIKYEERKVHVWHNNFNAFEHGDKTSKNNPLIYASEYPKEWGNTTNRTLYKGHIHTDKKVEYLTSNETAGFIEKTLPSLGKTDYYHYSNKYVGNRRSGKLELQDPILGNICELTYQSI